MFAIGKEIGPDSNKYSFRFVKAVFPDIYYFAFSYSDKISRE